MATKKQIRLYAEENGISREAAREHFINEAKKLRPKSWKPGYRPDLGTHYNGGEAYVHTSEMIGYVISMAQQGIGGKPGEFSVTAEYNEVEYLATLNFCEVYDDLIEAIANGAIALKLTLEKERDTQSATTGEPFIVCRVKNIEVHIRGNANLMQYIPTQNGNIARVTNQAFADGLKAGKVLV